MQHPRDLKVLPLAASRRGRPPLGFGLEVAAEVAVELPEAQNEPLVRCTERTGGSVIGVLEIDIFAASLIMDPDGAITALAAGVLERLRASGSVRSQPPLGLDRDDDGHGVRLQADLLRDHTGQRPALPYVTIVALAGASVRGSVVITMRSVADHWDAGERMLESVRVLDRDRGSGRGGRVAMPFSGR